MATINLGGLGFTLRIVEAQQGQKYVWELAQMSRVLHRGTSNDQKKAEKEAMTVFLNLSKTRTVKKNQRGAQRKKLQSYADRRPYLMAHVVVSLLQGMSRREVADGAEDGERFFHESDPPKFRRDLPDHPQALMPETAAIRIMGTMLELGMLVKDAETKVVRPTKKLRQYAIKLFGPGFLRENEIR